MDNKRKKLSYLFSKFPLTQVHETELTNVPREVSKLLEAKREKRRKLLESMYEKCRRTSATPLRHGRFHLYVGPSNSVQLARPACRPFSIELPRAEEKNIRRRIQARGLEDEHPRTVEEFIGEVKSEYGNVIRRTGMSLKIKSEGRFVVGPFKFAGRTERYSEFLVIRKILGRRWLLHCGVIRKIQGQCITNLPARFFQFEPADVMAIDEIQKQFDKFVELTKSIINDFYRNIREVIMTEKKRITSNIRNIIKGLLILHISTSVMETINSIVDFTIIKIPKSYLFIEINFEDNNLIMNPTSEKLETTYNNLIDDLLECCSELCIEEYPEKINLYITEEFIISSKTQIKRNITSQYETILQYLHNIDDKLCCIYKNLNSSEFLESIADITIEEGCEAINHYKRFLGITLRIPDHEFFRVATVSFVNYKSKLSDAITSNADLVFEKLANQHYWEVNDLCESFDHIRLRAGLAPETTEELVETGKYMNYVKTERSDALEQRVHEALLSLCRIIDLGLISDQHRELNCRSIGWLEEIAPVIENYTGAFDAMKYEAEERLQRTVEDVGEMIRKVFPLLAYLDDMDNIASCHSYIHFITLHMKKIREIEVQIEWINQEETTLSFPKSTYPEYEELKKYIYPFHHLLHLCLKVDLSLSAWQDGPFENLDYASTKTTVERYHKELTDTYKIYRQKLRQAQDENLPLKFKGTVDDPDILNWPAPLKLCGTALRRIEDFKPTVEVMRIICNKCLRERHWSALSEIAGADVAPDAGATLRKIMAVDFFGRLQEYEIISVGATKETLLLGQLRSLQEEWEGIDFQVSADGAYGLKVLVGLDEIETVFNDQNTIIFNMQGSVFVKPFEKEVSEFHETINRISDTVRYWSKIQNILLKLFPLISIQDLNEIIPNETNLLKRVIDVYNKSIKLIESVRNLIIENNQITSISNNRNEILQLTNPIPIEETLEKTFKALESTIIETLKNEIIECLKTFTTQQFPQQINDFTEQTLTVATNCIWTENIEMALCLNSHQHLKIQANNLQESINEKIQHLTNTTNNNKHKINSVITAEIHLKNAIETILSSGAISANNFEWEARFKHRLKNGLIKVAVMNFAIDYAYEYLESFRYIITSATERAHRMLISTFCMNYFGLITGEQDCGKYETLEILASIFGNYAVKFGCSEGLSGAVIERFVRGALLNGSWIYFEDFASLKASTVSSISEYLFSVQTAKKENSQHCRIGEDLLSFKPSCFICVSTKRNSFDELPDNVKNLFRVTAIIAPDVEKIVEITLQIQGFSTPRILAKKITYLVNYIIDVASEELSYIKGLGKYTRILAECSKLKTNNFNQNDVILTALNNTIARIIPNKYHAEFHAISRSLFPNSNLIIPKDDTTFQEAIKTLCGEDNFQYNEELGSKIREVYETLQHNPSLVIAGSLTSFKTTAIKLCAKLFEKSNCRLQLSYVTPNCFDYRSLYGRFTDCSEWQDGVVTKLLRSSTADDTDSLIVFDGGINYNWIENVIGVLKERKLHLESGEILAMRPKTRLVFEVEDLNHCSPSMISHSTVVYINYKSTDWEVIVLSWSDTSKSEWMKEHREYIRDILCWLLRACLEFIQKNCVALYAISDVNLVNNVIDLTTLVLDEACSRNKREEDWKNLTTWIQATIIQTGMLGMGSLLDVASRQKFDEFYRLLWRGQNQLYPYPKSFAKLEVGIPQDGLIIEYQYIYKQRGNWKSCQDLLKAEKPFEMPYVKNIFVPTVETLKYINIINLLLNNNLPVLLIGPTCTGKTAIIQTILRTKLEEDKWDVSHINSNTYLNSKELQENVLSKLNKKQGGVYCPSKNKRFAMFIDNLHQTPSDKYNNSQCIELLRQHLDHKIWYDLDRSGEISIENLTLISAMDNSIPNKSINRRFLKHFRVFGFNEVTDDTVSRIYSNVLLHFWRRGGFPSDVTNLTNQIVNATCKAYRKISSRFRATLKRPYYCFNLNNISDVIDGCRLLRKETYDANKKISAKLWVNECFKVFGNRLDARDICELEDIVRDILDSNFNEIANELSELSKITLTTINDKEKYEELDRTALIDTLNNELLRYNNSNSIKINVAYFEYAVEKIIRITRVLSIRPGNALFLGASGLGKASLIKLVSHVYGYPIYQPLITENYAIDNWKKDLKRVLKEAGAVERELVYLVDERDVIDEEFLQYADLLLGTGDVCDIFAAEEKQEILELSRLSAQGGNRNLDISTSAVFMHFTARCKYNLHLILSLSIESKTLRNRFYKFPSLKNCHTIFWDDWPDEALREIAKRKIDNSNCIDTFIHFHRHFQQLSIDLPLKLHISPIYFIHLTDLHSELYSNEKTLIENKIDTFSQGLGKLSYAANQILDMERVLADYTPQLAEMTAKAKEMTEQIALETIEVEKASELVRQDEQIACQQAIVAQNLKSECESELAQAIPILEDAISALNTLKPSDITLVKSMKNPPDAIKLVMAAVCVIKDIKPDRIPDPSTGRKTFDYWGPSKRVLGDMNFLQTLKDFDKDNIKAELMVKIRKDFLPHKDFKPHVVAKASSAAEGLCKWIIAMDMYDKVAKEVAPKKEKLEKAEKEYANTMEILNQKKDEVKRIEEKLSALNALLDESNKKQLILQREVDTCNKKLISAQKLLGSLGEEQLRWTDAVKKLKKQQELLLGNVALTAGIVAYLSPLDFIARNEVTKRWHQHVIEHLPCSNQFELELGFSSKIDLESKQQSELLRDRFFKENVLICDFSKQRSIFIDPDYQAEKWIRKSEKGNHLVVTTFSQDCLSVLINCVESGRPILINKINNIPRCLYDFISNHCFNQDGATFVNINNSSVRVNENFRLYLTCNVSNPNFLPELINKITIINFAISSTYLKKRFLRMVSEFEKPTLKKRKKEIYSKKNKHQLDISNTEKEILQTLCSSQADILEDEESIKILENYKISLKTLRSDYEGALEAERSVFEFADQYKSVANFVTDIYLFVSKLKRVNHVYQFSFECFLYTYYQTILYAEKSKIVAKRCENIKRKFTEEIFSKINYTLFEKDKFTFAFMLTITILMHNKSISSDELTVFLSNVSDGCSWLELAALENLPVFHKFRSNLRINFAAWKTYLNNASFTLAPDLRRPLSNFQALVLTKTFKPHHLHHHMRLFVRLELGEDFLDPPRLRLNRIYNDSNCMSPILLVSNAEESLDELRLLVKKKQLSHTFRSLCIGDSTTPDWRRFLLEAQEKGYWILFQNCHLDLLWVRDLEKQLECMNYDNTNNNFRLWLSTGNSPDLPVNLLQRSIKVTYDCGGSFKSTLASYFEKEYICDYFCGSTPGKKDVFTKLLFGLVAFHCCLIERRKYDRVLWNFPCNYSDDAFEMSAKLLQELLANSVSCDRVAEIIGSYQYGGHRDLKCIELLLKDFINVEVIRSKKYCYNELKEYCLPMKTDYLDYLKAIKSYPDVDNAELFGVNKKLCSVRWENISKEVVNTMSIVWCIQNKTPIENYQTYLLDKVEEIFNMLPNKLEINNDVVLKYEFARYNNVLGNILNSLKLLKKSLKGEIGFTEEIHCTATSIYNSLVPRGWEILFHATNETLSNFLGTLNEKINYLRNFRFDENCVWLAAFALPRALLSRIKLKLSEVGGIPAEDVTFRSAIVNSNNEIYPENGISITGLFAGNSKWDLDNQRFCEATSELFNALPPIRLQPVLCSELDGAVEFPLLQTHDFNSFICNVNLFKLPMHKHWIKRGVTFVIKARLMDIIKYERPELKYTYAACGFCGCSTPVSLELSFNCLAKIQKRGTQCVYF
ncbi:unnamed protein product [Phyllotreta striolata]|uniref:Uncharacterized protein n=1 Tax=Phyllotreta striolata TaxID=444603 RepID=A0A9N9XSY7_PHYSR|nr:unnamed protein product [Phyllotreta striolata]